MITRPARPAKITPKKGRVKSVECRDGPTTYGIGLRKQSLRLIQPGINVTTIICDNRNNSEIIWVLVTKVKDDTVWGIAQDTCRLREDLSDCSLPSGSTHSFPLSTVSGICIYSAPKRIRKELNKYLKP